METHWHENGQIWLEEHFSKDEVWIPLKTKEWHDNGQKSKEGYADKDCDGTSIQWHKNGQLYKRESWRDGSLLEIEIYDDAGNPCKFTTYRDGTGSVARYRSWGLNENLIKPSRILIYKDFKLLKVLED